MAGIGFDLKKLFDRKGALATIRAYGYTAAVCAGPMILSIAMLLGIRFISISGDIDGQSQDLLVSMITYCLLGSLLTGSVLSMVTTRYVSDMLYEGKLQYVLPSLYGSLFLQLAAGGAVYGVFLCLSGIPLTLRLLNLVLFCELAVVWTQMNYMTAVKGYRSILVLFVIGVTAALFFGWASVRWLRLDSVSALMGSVILGFGLIQTGFFFLLHSHFPQGQGSVFRFLSRIDRYPSLLFVGLFLMAGLFAHIVITWFSPLGIRVTGLFYSAPQYDIPSMAAFLSMLVSTVNFTVSVEVNFYPHYREYIRLFNEGGALGDIQLAEDEMLLVLRQEISYLAYRQFVVTVLFIIVGTPLLQNCALGFTAMMLGTFRILCVGYGLYAIANSMLLVQLYFSDNAGAFRTSLAFLACSVAGTLATLHGRLEYYGFGFLGAGFVMYVTAWVRLWKFTGNLQHHILSAQPVFQQTAPGLFTRFGLVLQKQNDLRIHFRKKRHSEINIQQ